MTRIALAITFIFSLLAALTACSFLGGSGRSSGGGITQEELVRRTQQLMDATAVGDKVPFQKYFADDCLFFDEKGRDMNKEALVADITGLPQGYSGTIKIENAKSHIDGRVAILSYDMDETEMVFGQTEKARYHETDTWMRRKGDWQIVAGQVLRYYADPAAGAAKERELADYVGTYELAPGKTLTVSRDGDRLFRQRGETKTELIPEGGPIFFRKGVEGRIVFHRGVGGKVDTLIDRRNNEDVVWRKVG